MYTRLILYTHLMLYFQATEEALTQFTTITEKYFMVPFPPALFGMGKALAQLHCHLEALEKAKEGLKLLPSYHLPASLTWPGTSEVLNEALAQNVEVCVCVCVCVSLVVL